MQEKKQTNINQRKKGIPYSHQIIDRKKKGCKKNFQKYSEKGRNISTIDNFFFCTNTVRLLLSIFFLTKSAKKVRLLFLRGLEARRGFFGRSGLKFEVSSLSREGSRPPASFLGGLMASLARAPAGPTHALCLTSQHLSPLQEECHKGHPDAIFHVHMRT